MNPPLLETRGLTHVFPDGTAGIADVNLTLNAGTFTVLAGANGSGKTVLMRHLNGLMRPSTGEVRLEGRNILNDLPGARRRVALVFQDADAQIVGQSVARDTAFGPENLRLPRQEIADRVQAALSATGLCGFDDRRPHTLSGGEKRRLAVAGVLAMEPDILVLDEPFTGLDWPGSADLLAVLDRLHRAGRTILLISHDLDKMLAHADRLVLMSAGRIAAEGTPEEVIALAEELGVRRPPGRVSGMTWSRDGAQER